MRKAFLILLVIVCLATAAWNGYLLLTNQTDPLIGWIVLGVSVGVLLWNTSVLRAYRIRAGTVVAVCIVVAFLAMTVSAYAGIEPFAEVKDSLALRVSGIFAVGDDAAAQRVVRATINAYNRSRGDKLVDLTTQKAYDILTRYRVGGHPMLAGDDEVIDYELIVLYSVERRYDIHVRGGIRGWIGVVEPYNYVYVVERVRVWQGPYGAQDGYAWLVTDIIPLSRYHRR